MSASYPAAVKTFASRSNGQTIDASHVGDLQDEVNAIEAGLLNGTAPLNSSNSTLAALSVAGGSTLAGTLQVNGLSTFSTNVVIAGSLTVGGVSILAGPTLFAVTGSTATNSSAFVTVLSFEISSGTWADSQVINIIALTQVAINSGSTASLSFRWSVGGNLATLGTAVNQAGTGGVHLLNYQLVRNSTTIWIRNGTSVIAADDYTFAYNNLGASGAATATQLNGVTFGSSNTVALQVAWSAANSSNSYGVLSARAVKS